MCYSRDAFCPPSLCVCVAAKAVHAGSVNCRKEVESLCAHRESVACAGSRSGSCALDKHARHRVYAHRVCAVVVCLCYTPTCAKRGLKSAVEVCEWVPLELLNSMHSTARSMKRRFLATLRTFTGGESGGARRRVGQLTLSAPSIFPPSTSYGRLSQSEPPRGLYTQGVTPNARSKAACGHGI